MAQPTEKPAPAKPAKSAAARRRPSAGRNGHAVSDPVELGQPAPTDAASEPAAQAPTSEPAEVAYAPGAPAADVLATEASGAEGINAGSTPSVPEPAPSAAASDQVAGDPGLAAEPPATAPLAWLNGFAGLRDEMAAFARAQLEDAIATGQAMLGCGSLLRAFELQAGYALRTMQSNLAQAARLARLSADLVQAASTPRKLP
jgi:hypothetical protein